MSAQVRLVGAVLPREIPLWLKQCDIGVLPTRRDVFLDYSFSNKLSEYVIMDKAVIVARLAAIRNYFSEEALTYFEPGTPPTWRGKWCGWGLMRSSGSARRARSQGVRPDSLGRDAGALPRPGGRTERNRRRPHSNAMGPSTVRALPRAGGSPMVRRGLAPALPLPTACIAMSSLRLRAMRHSS